MLDIVNIKLLSFNKYIWNYGNKQFIFSDVKLISCNWILSKYWYYLIMGAKKHQDKRKRHEDDED